MTKRYLEHLIVAVLGFLMGAVVAMLIAPGDARVMIGTGIIFGLYARALCDQNFGGDWLWPFGRPAGRKTLAAKPGIGHRSRRPGSDLTIRKQESRPWPLR
jgi:hypothetical protein